MNTKKEQAFTWLPLHTIIAICVTSLAINIFAIFLFNRMFDSSVTKMKDDLYKAQLQYRGAVEQYRAAEQTYKAIKK